MVSELKIHEYRDNIFESGMMIVGFPSVGLVSSIAANYIVRTSGLNRIAGVLSPDFPPYTLINQGVPSPPVRIYAGDRKCTDTELCKQIVAVVAEFMPKPETIKPLADSLLDYCDEKGIKTVVTLEGVAKPGSSDLSPMGVGSTQAARDMLSKYGVEEMKEGIISGISGVLLYEGERRDIDVMCLLGAARAEYPDARGSAKLLEVVAKMLPELKIDPDPLYREAEEMEKQLKKAQESTNPQHKSSFEDSVIYG